METLKVIKMFLQSLGWFACACPNRRGMQHAAVVPGPMLPHGTLFFQHRDARVPPPRMTTPGAEPRLL
jgi:hypothetical protein